MHTKYVRCFICGADNGEVLIERSFPRHMVCRDCGFVYLNPMPDFERNKDFYNKDYWEEHHGFTGPKKEYLITSRQKRMQLWILPHLKLGSKILEIGCGFGFNLDFLNQNNKSLNLELEGLEISREGCENLEKAFGITCHNTTIEEFKTEKKYDVIIMSHVLEHFEDPSDVLGKAWNILNDKGILWVEVPNIMYPNPTKNLNNWLAKEHISYFSPDKLRYLLMLNGFQIIEQKHLHFVGFLAQKVQKGKAKADFKKEYHDVKKALRKQKIRNKIIRIKSRLGIKTTKYKS